MDKLPKIIKIKDKEYAEFLTDRHNWAEQVLPIDREAVRCGYCELVAPMIKLPAGGCIERIVLRELKDA